MSDAADLAELWMDTTCRAVFPRTKTRLRFTGEPVIVRAPRPSWHENVEARVRYALHEMLPHDDKCIEGVRVIRDSETHEHGGNLYYWIAGQRVKDFESAVSTVIQHIQERTV